MTRIPAFVSVVAMAFAASATAALSLFFCAMGTTTTCMGASAGGSRSPASSPCVMMIPPMRRVETPQEDWYTCRVSPFSSRKVVSNALEKFWPRLCDVPACSALPSPIIASMVYVQSAPANDSTRDLRPTMTGIAATVSANRA